MGVRHDEPRADDDPGPRPEPSRPPGIGHLGSPAAATTPPATAAASTAAYPDDGGGDPGGHRAGCLLQLCDQGHHPDDEGELRFV